MREQKFLMMLEGERKTLLLHGGEKINHDSTDHFLIALDLNGYYNLEQENVFVPVTHVVATAVATVIQWFGSPVGFSVLGEILGEAGYKIVPSKKRKPLTARRLKIE